MTADLRTTLHAVEVARDVVRVSGPDAITYLQGQVSHDVADLAPGEVGWTFVLQPAGKVDAWARLVRTADDEVVFDIDGGFGEALIARLRRFLLRTKADVDPAGLAGRGAPGPRGRGRRPGRGDGRPARAGRVAGRRGLRPGRARRGASRRRAGGEPRRLRVPAHPLRHPGDGRRADRDDDPGRGGAGDHRRLRQLHQGLLHRPGAGRPHRQPRRQRAPSPARPGPARRRRPPVGRPRGRRRGRGRVGHVGRSRDLAAARWRWPSSNGRSSRPPRRRWPARPPPSSPCRSRTDRWRGWGSGRTTTCSASR